MRHFYEKEESTRRIIFLYSNNHYLGIPSHSKKGGANANPKNTSMKIMGSDMLLVLCCLKHIIFFSILLIIFM